MMKKILKLSLFSLLILTSCESEDDSGTEDLTFLVSGTAVVIPESDTYDWCSRQDVDSDRFSINRVQILWDRFGYDLEITIIRMEFQDSNVGGEVVMNLAGEDFDRVFGYSTNGGTDYTVVANGFVPGKSNNTTTEPAVMVKLQDNCRLHFGGFTIEDQERNFSATARITLIGVATVNEAGAAADLGAEGDQEPVRASTTFRVVYDLN